MMAKKNLLLAVSAALVYLFLYLPLVIVVVFSFNDSKLNAEWVGFTWKWYGKLLYNQEMLTAAMNSLIIASVSAGIATILGTLAGVAVGGSVGRSMAERDRYMTAQTLETVRTGVSGIGRGERVLKA